MSSNIERKLLRQLKALKSQIANNDRRGVNTSWKIAESLNELREQLVHWASDAEAGMLASAIRPLEINRSATFSVNSQEALVMCERLIEVFDEAEYMVDATIPDQDHINRFVPDTKSVFLIHGHDHANMLRLKDMLRDRFGVTPVVLSERPEKGRTLIEKFEKEAGNVAYAFAIMTPDDFVQTTARTHTQARPNVIFELGWFYGRLGRERVCVLSKKGTSIHSDLHGLMKVEFTESVTERLGEIERELRSAGLV